MHKQFMELAIEKAREGMNHGQTPFGACIVKDGNVVSVSHNEVWKTTDITAHAEVQAIRKACQKLGTIDLSGCTLYSSCEPCPMCFSAIHWAKIDTVYFGARIADAERGGFNELSISNEQMKEMGGSPLQIKAEFMSEEAKKVFDEWVRKIDKRVY